MSKKFEFKRIYKWKKENNILFNMFKEYILKNYEYDTFFSYYKYININFLNYLEYNFYITKTMKIKSFLWTSPFIVKNNNSLIELRSLTNRINELIMLKSKYYNWKKLRFK